MIKHDTLKIIIEGKDWGRLSNYLDSLSHSEFRKAESFVREIILPELSNEDFWESLLHLIKYKKQAFLPCVVAVKNLVEKNVLVVRCKEAAEVASYMKNNMPEASLKLVSIAIPFLRTEEQINDFFDVFGIENERNKISVLIKETSLLTYFVLFKTLKQVQDNQSLARQCCLFIMKKNDDMSYNMASLLREYFSLEGLRSQLSLHIAPYELSYAESSFDKFKNIITGKVPKL